MNGHRLRAWILVVAMAGGVMVGAMLSVPGRVRAQADCRPIETFADARVGEFPPDWKVRKDEGKSVYSVADDGGARYLRAVSNGQGIQAAKEYEWDLNAYPILAWSWRVEEFPRGADEQNGKNDSAVAVYVLVPHSKIRGPKAVKYIWSEKVPAGTRLESNGGLTQVRVLRSGHPGAGQWVEERVNARDDFRTYFKEDQAPKPVGIAVLTDADDTKSRARGDYTNFRVCRG